MNKSLGLNIKFLLSILSVIFTLTLFYLTIELPRLLHKILIAYIPNYFARWNIESMKMMLNFLCPPGVISLLIVIILIIIRNIIEKTEITDLWPLHTIYSDIRIIILKTPLNIKT